MKSRLSRDFVATWRHGAPKRDNVAEVPKIFSSSSSSGFLEKFLGFLRKKFIFFEKNPKIFLKIQLKIDKKKNRKKSSWFLRFSAKIFLKMQVDDPAFWAVIGRKSSKNFFLEKNLQNFFLWKGGH